MRTLRKKMTSMRTDSLRAISLWSEIVQITRVL